MVPIKITWWPNVGVSLVSRGIFFLYDWLAANFIFYPLIALVGFYPALLIILIIVIEGFNVYFAVTALLGGWDKNMLDEFEDAASYEWSQQMVCLAAI